MSGAASDNHAPGSASTSASLSTSRPPRRAPGISALAQRLPGQRTPPDPSIEQPNAADLTYGWHAASPEEGEGTHSSSSSNGDSDGTENAAGRRRRRHGHATSDDEDSSDEDAFHDAHAQGPQWAPVWPGAPRQGDIARRRQLQGALGHGADSFLAKGGRWLRKLIDGGVGDELPNLDDDPQWAGAPAEDAGPDHLPHNSDSFICRICFDGPGSMDDGGEHLGRLIAPCRCRGTMKFVHQGCLTRWRATSARQTSVMSCDQCGSPYRFRKSRFVGLATNRLLLLLVSCYLFTTIVWVVGFAAETAVRYMDGKADENVASTYDSAYTSSRRHKASHQPSQMPSTASRLYSWINLDPGSSTEDDDLDYYHTRYDYRWAYSEPAAYVTLIKAAVKYVGSGRALRHVWPVAEVFQIDEGHVSAHEGAGIDESQGWWASLVNDWKYGKGGIWEGKQLENEQEQPSSRDSDNEINNAEPNAQEWSELAEGTTSAKERPPASPGRMQRERYDARAARVLGPGEETGRSHGCPGRSAQRPYGKVRSTLLERLLLQLSLGASLVGMSSFLSLLLGVSTWGPFHLNLGLGRGFARVARRRTRGGGGSGGGGGGTSEGEALIAVFLLVLVAVGIIRALMAVYALTTHVSKRMLVRVEDIIVDWSGEEEEQQQQQRARQNAPVSPGGQPRPAPAGVWHRVVLPSLFSLRRRHPPQHGLAEQ